ncbi:cell death abnormality protein 1-like [Crassostrea angulata]|uniref:cell death abnormality protein 1-like n=1 Tax=Magallana angulata TaxID=2784310 RepID=UPI0022B1D2FC|nr:cell death abnormality protein 1-like [Crassostrea angulata]
MTYEYTWFTVTLICIAYGCEIGYVGYNCTKPCRYPSYGERCQKACNCTEDLCDHRLGCILPQKCREGYYGPGCISPCRYPSFGIKCQYMCSCQLYDCNHIIGCNNISESTKPNEDWLEGKQLINILIVTGNFVLFGTIGISIIIYVKIYRSKRNERRKQAYKI